jgi:hypothetical protein
LALAIAGIADKPPEGMFDGGEARNADGGGQFGDIR